MPLDPASLATKEGLLSFLDSANAEIPKEAPAGSETIDPFQRGTQDNGTKAGPAAAEPEPEQGDAQADQDESPPEQDETPEADDEPAETQDPEQTEAVTEEPKAPDLPNEIARLQALQVAQAQQQAALVQLLLQQQAVAAQAASVPQVHQEPEWKRRLAAALPAHHGDRDVRDAADAVLSAGTTEKAQEALKAMGPALARKVDEHLRSRQEFARRLSDPVGLFEAIEPAIEARAREIVDQRLGPLAAALGSRVESEFWARHKVQDPEARRAIQELTTRPLTPDEAAQVWLMKQRENRVAAEKQEIERRQEQHKAVKGAARGGRSAPSGSKQERPIEDRLRGAKSIGEIYKLAEAHHKASGKKG